MRQRLLAYVLVALGGFAGTLARYSASPLFDEHADWPIATLIVNIIGAFALGIVLRRLADRNPSPVSHGYVRLLLGTGFLGSFTTYSAFAVEAERLLAHGSYDTAIGYLAVSLGCGLLACAAGVALAGVRHPGTST